MVYIKVLRPYNLLFILFTQSVLHYYVVAPLSGGIVLLHGWLFPLFTFVTAIIAGSGYLINDIFDFKTDGINKPEKCFIPDIISVRSAMSYYFILIFTGFLMAFYIARVTQSFHYIWLYPMAVLLLYLYSSYFKSTILLGNVIVSIFIAGVTGVVFLAQSLSLPENTPLQKILLEMCWVLMSLSFLLNLIREIIKDLEDREGDLRSGIKTIATVLPLHRIQSLLYLLTGVLVITIFLWMLKSELAAAYSVRAYMIVFIVAPLLMMSIKIKGARNKADYSQISKISKLILLAGVISILIIACQT